MPSMACLKTPSRSTAMSWLFSMPSRWTLKTRLGCGLKSFSRLRRNMPLVHSWLYRPRFRISSHMMPISGSSSGSPPQIETIGAPHSSTAFRQFSSDTRSRMLSSYSRMRPQPVQVRLQACSGSSIITSGKRLLIIGCDLRFIAGICVCTMRNGLAESSAAARFFCHSGLGRSLFLAM